MSILNVQRIFFNFNQRVEILNYLDQKLKYYIKYQKPAVPNFPALSNFPFYKWLKKRQLQKNSINNTFHKTLRHEWIKITRVFDSRILNLNSCLKTVSYETSFLIYVLLKTFNEIYSFCFYKNVPYVGCIPKGLPSMYQLVIYGRTKILPYTFLINLQEGGHIWPHPVVTLHLNPRFGNF